jgi:hypothetical protein
MREDISKPGYRVWTASRGMSLFMLLPAVAMAVAAMIVPADAVTDDGAPLKPALLMGAGFWIVTNFAILFVMGRINEKRRRLFEQGLDGRALILGVEETGTTINDMPVLRIRLRVNDGYHGEYETVHKEAIPLTVIPRLVQGGEIAVKVDREKQDRLLLLL